MEIHTELRYPFDTARISFPADCKPTPLIFTGKLPSGNIVQLTLPKTSITQSVSPIQTVGKTKQMLVMNDGKAQIVPVAG